jgi:ABC-2 type transport system ATP-binding protein
MNDYTNAIEISNLTKKFDGFTLNSLNMSVPKGSIMGFIGQNGSGKTTTIKLLLNILHRNSGNIKIFGMDNTLNEKEIKENISVVFDELPFHDELNPTQINTILRNIYKEWNSETYKSYLDRFSLPQKKKLGKFSKGMKMKLQIATALSHNAKLLIMDEATTGLDPVVRSEILDIFLEFLQEEDHTIFMSSHITSDLEKIADSITFIDKGELLISGYKDDILENHGVMKCSKNDYKNIDIEDVVSVRTNEFNIDVMVKDKALCRKKYSGLIMDNTTLEEIMLFYIKNKKRSFENERINI